MRSALLLLLLAGCATNAGVVVSSDPAVCMVGGETPRQDITICNKWKEK